MKSALGRYPREEDAVVLQEAQVMAFTVPEFEALAMKNTRMITKMLKVFSNQLRHIHRQVQNLLGSGEAGNPEAGLYQVGVREPCVLRVEQSRVGGEERGGHAGEDLWGRVRDGERDLVPEPCV